MVQGASGPNAVYWRRWLRVSKRVARISHPLTLCMGGAEGEIHVAKPKPGKVTPY